MTTKPHLYVFDLDGTLIDSSHTIYDTTMATLKELNLDYHIDKNELDKRIGAHFADIFIEMNIPVPDVEHFIARFIEKYFDHINSSKFYPGVREAIEMLHLRGDKIAMVTTKAQGQADKIVDLFGLRPFFSYVMGRRPGLETKPSAEPLLKVIEELGFDKNDAVMVGDSEFDVRCGKNAGVKTVALSYGYRERDFLIAENPDFLIDNLSEIIDLKVF